MSVRRRITLLNIAIDDVGREEALARFTESRITVTPNIDHLWNLQRNRQFYDLYRRADLLLCDSRVLSLLLGITGTVVEALPGSEFFPEACGRMSKADPQAGVFLLGGTTPEHARLAATKMQGNGARVVGAYSPPFGFEQDRCAVESIASMIVQTRATVVGVGVGSPKQELVIARLSDLLPKIHFVGIGATIDFESGLVSRAPKLFRTLRLEWLYRFACEPTRLFKRYFVRGPAVLALLASQLLGIYKDPFGSDVARGSR
jgi:N-acetylglucosaminyldiphosphoundecaprenol N-acetyl-beta-D-mannosaminyltransferase